jgi:regulator of protease activity HflC (stomatin/prohibitin superfamily)
MTRINIEQTNGVAVTTFALCLAAGALTGALMNRAVPIVIGAIVGAYLLFAIKVVRQWEKVALLRLGRYVGLRGPGLFLIIPIVETLSPYVDQRVRVASVTARIYADS